MDHSRRDVYRWSLGTYIIPVHELAKKFSFTVVTRFSNFSKWYVRVYILQCFNNKRLDGTEVAWKKFQQGLSYSNEYDVLSEWRKSENFVNDGRVIHSRLDIRFANWKLTITIYFAMNVSQLIFDSQSNSLTFSLARPSTVIFVYVTPVTPLRLRRRRR
jgi:hypothetical protein